MGAVSVSIGSPSRRRRSSSFAASAMISWPMPSPGSSAIFTISAQRAAECTGRPRWFLVGVLVSSASMLLEQPRLLGFALFLESANLVRVLQGKADVVETVQHAMLAKRIDIEAEYSATVGRRNGLLLEIDGELESWKSS